MATAEEEDVVIVSMATVYEDTFVVVGTNRGELFVFSEEDSKEVSVLTHMRCKGRMLSIVTSANSAHILASNEDALIWRWQYKPLPGSSPKSSPKKAKGDEEDE